MIWRIKSLGRGDEISFIKKLHFIYFIRNCFQGAVVRVQKPASNFILHPDNCTLNKQLFFIFVFKHFTQGDNKGPMLPLRYNKKPWRQAIVNALGFCHQGTIAFRIHLNPQIAGDTR